MRSLVLSAVALFTACGPLQMNKEQAAEFATRMSRSTGSAAFKALAPVDVAEATVTCDQGGSMRLNVSAMASGNSASATFSMTANNCKYEADDRSTWTVNGGPVTATYAASGTSSGANMAMLNLSVTMNGGPITVTGASGTGSVKYDNLRISTNVDTTNNSFRLRSAITGSITVDGTTYSYTNDSYDFRYTIDLNP